MTGTPTASSVPRLRAKRLIAILVNSVPNTGSRSLSRSNAQPPGVVVAQLALEPGRCRRRRRPTKSGHEPEHLVAERRPGSASAAAACRRGCANIFSKIGTMKISTPAIISRLKQMHDDRVGQRRLDLAAQRGVLLEVRRRCGRARCRGSRRSRRRATIAIISRGKILSCLASAPDSDRPRLDVAADVADRLAERGLARSAPRGSPASAAATGRTTVIVANWRGEDREVLERDAGRRRPGILISLLQARAGLARSTAGSTPCVAQRGRGGRVSSRRRACPCCACRRRRAPRSRRSCVSVAVMRSRLSRRGA